MTLVLASHVLGQSSANPDSPTKPLTRLVKLQVAAMDAGGHPVTDLGVSDVRLREEKNPVPILFFGFAGTKNILPPLGANEFGNQGSGSPLVVLVDRWNDGQIGSAEAWRELASTLQELESTENVYLYVLTDRGTLSPIKALPASEAERRATSSISPAELRNRFLQVNGQFKSSRGLNDAGGRAKATFDALEELRASMALLPGRKSLVWISAGLPMTLRSSNSMLDLTPQMEILSENAARASIAAYTVALAWPPTAFSAASSPWLSLKMLAEMTGGRWYSDHRVQQAVADALADTRASYRLVYAAPAREKSDRQLGIRLESERRDVHLLSRHSVGVLAEPDPDELETVLVGKVRRSSFDASEIGLRVAVARNGDGVHFEVRLDPTDVLVEHVGNRYSAVLDVAIAYFRDGFYKESARPFRVNMSLTQAQYDVALKSGVLIPVDEKVGAEIESARVIIYDRGVHGVGSVTIPMK